MNTFGPFALVAVLAVPATAAAILALLPDYRLSARVNVAASLLTFILALALFPALDRNRRSPVLAGGLATLAIASLVLTFAVLKPRFGAGIVDYGAVCQQVWLAAQKQSYKTLERLCGAIADHLMDHFGVDSVMVRATKPEPPIPLPVGDVAVEVWKER